MVVRLREGAGRGSSRRIVRCDLESDSEGELQDATTDNMSRSIIKTGLQKRREKEREALGGARAAFDEDDVVDINDICTINVSGLRFQTRKSTLNRFPSTLLGSPDREKYINPKTSEYFFDRHRESFETILYFYQSNGLLCLPATLNPDIFIEEVRFFRLGDHILEKLCPDIINTKDIILPDHPLQRKVWQLFEDPQSGVVAKCIAYVDISMILLAISAVCVETLPTFDHTNDPPSDLFFEHLDQKVFFGIEVVCIVWFSIELIARFASCPNKRDFWKSILNWIDLAAILPFYIGLMVPRSMDLQSLVFIRMIRFTRIFRIFKMSRHFAGLLALAYALKAGCRELALLFLLLSICVVLFSSMVYFVDMSDEDSPFHSIIEAFWWSIVTMSTVGYGDYVPKTPLGKIVGVFCALMGILVIALPFPIIVSRFNYYYELEKSGKSLEDGEIEEEFTKPMFMGVIYAFKGSKAAYEGPLKEEPVDGNTGYKSLSGDSPRLPNSENHISAC